MKVSFITNQFQMRGMLLMLFAVVLLNGCKVAHMALPQDLKSASSELAVEGLRGKIFVKSFNFGRYDVVDIQKGWTKGEGFSIFGFGSSKAKQRYEFKVNESGETKWKVRCSAKADWNELDLDRFTGGGISVEFSYDRQMICTMRQVGSEKILKLVMAQTFKELMPKGVMIDGDTRVDISVSHKVDTSPLRLGDPTGYVFHINNRPVGAVEIINKGTVWLNNSLKPETRSALAATSAALLLHQDIKKLLQRN
jgi:hypothetical protein